MLTMVIIIINIIIVSAAEVEILSENRLICISGCKTTVCLVEDQLTVQQATTTGMSL